MLEFRNLGKDVPIAPFTTYQIGGPADYFITANSKSELAEAVSSARNENMPYFILGTGANILVGDKGFRGLVIHNQAKSFHFDDNLLIAESGCVITDLITESVKKGLSGLEHFAGIPSSVGGAIWQNLHFLAPDRKSTIFIGQFIKSADILDRTGEVHTVGNDFFQFGYDDSILHHQEIAVLDVTFALDSKPSTQIEERVIANLAWRSKKQPQLSEYPSCGSVFKKIEGVGAGRLIDKAGLKNKQIGGAAVSSKHTNYIVNKANATAADVRKLISIVQSEVKRDSGYNLEPEISFIGEF
ncbi:MAG TPA: UDP-N-acetylmuramate dehydrogenase [Candidatus Saccharimonadales bacterium]|nr:UDP-N-acetylmuramate dehydrogenase [Candidatus Saccharimonadales bacterium]